MKRVALGMLLSTFAVGCGSSGSSSDPTDASVLSDAEGDGFSPNLDGATCASKILCGAEGVCCAADQECLASACVTTCASGVRCGSTCCDAGKACVDGACTSPTGPCDDSVDCVPGEICEPALGKCLPAPKLATCTIKRTPQPFAPTLLWSFTTPTVLPAYDQPISAPLVVDLDGDKAPDVVVTTGDKNLVTATNPGYLRALDGKTGTEKWAASVDALQTGNRVQVTSAPAIGDLDGDGAPEIVALGETGEILAFSAKGALVWRSKRADGSSYRWTTDQFFGSAISLADMDADGKGEVVLGGVVLSHLGVVVSGDARPYAGSIAETSSLVGSSSVIADVDGDGKLDVVAGNAAYRKDGTTIWSQPSYVDGFPALADLDGDGAAELVVAAPDEIRVHDAKTGAFITRGSFGGRAPGPVVLSDVDGDGHPEIVVQSWKPCAAIALDYDKAKTLTTKWNRPLVACSGYLTPTAFDFDGDGRVEVLAHDDCYVHLLDGTTGEVKKKLPASHNTWTEFVTVADVDGVAGAELLFSAHDAWNGGTLDWKTYCAYPEGDTAKRGVYVFHDVTGKWMPTRRVWNQQSYHVTNVRVGGELPKGETASWGSGGFNNYRAAVQGKGEGLAPDLSVSLAVSLEACPTSYLLRATVRNEGSIGVAAGVVVRFYAGTMLLGEAKTKKPLFAGGAELVELTVMASSGTSFTADVDGGEGGVVAECNEKNNVASIGGVNCSKIK